MTDSTPHPEITPRLRRWLFVEFTLLCIVLPTIIISMRLAPQMFLFLWGACAYCILAYRYTPGTRGEEVWRWKEVNWQSMKPILVRFAVSSVFMWVFITVYDPDRRYEIVLEKPDLYWKIMFAYPILSALPQEFIFCSFFFARYVFLLPKKSWLVAGSTLVFAYAHVLFINPVAPVLSLAAGYFFATTYAKHRSLALVTIEHALYGNMMFTLGLGWYFWGGALRQASMGG